MVDFGNALKKGLEAHKRAAEARKEMEDVLAAASSEMKAVTNSPISLQFQEVARSRVPGTSVIQGKPDALTARLDTGPFTVLGEVTFGDLGYPVTVRWQNNRDSANDRASFEELIKTILEHSATGAEIAALIAKK